MPGGPLPYLVVALVGLAIAAGGIALLRASGARVGLGRRLAGAREVKVGSLFDAQDLPSRPLRILGRIRCPNPLVTPDGDRLVAYHRDVEVRLPSGAWRVVDRLRETRSFELWDHAGSLRVDPAAAEEPLITIPKVWHGQPDELDEAFRPAVERLSAEHGTPAAARATTRTIAVTDRLLVLARVVSDGAGRPALAPPESGYIISALSLDAAMRLLGGPRRGSLLAGASLTAVGAGAALIGSVLWLVAMLAG